MLRVSWTASHAPAHRFSDLTKVGTQSISPLYWAIKTLGTHIGSDGVSLIDDSSHAVL